MAKVAVPDLIVRTTSDSTGHPHGLTVGTGPNVATALENQETEATRIAQDIASEFAGDGRADTEWPFEIIGVRLVAGQAGGDEAWACYGTLVSAGKHPWDPGAWKIGQ